MQISKYKRKHESDVLSAIGKDPDWEIFTSDDTKAVYKKALGNSITYVCYNNSTFCGYVRALVDKDLAVYISELYVVPEWRNQKIGQALLEQVKADFNRLTVYAFSDEDAYYQKKGYRRLGSVYQL